MKLAYNADANEWRDADTGKVIDPLPPGPYGVTDGKGGWVGDDAGPVTYADPIAACVSAAVLDMRLGDKPGTWRVAVFTGANRKRGELPVVMTGLEALKKLEDGTGLDGNPSPTKEA